MLRLSLIIALLIPSLAISGVSTITVIKPNPTAVTVNNTSPPVTVVVPGAQGIQGIQGPQGPAAPAGAYRTVTADYTLTAADFVIFIDTTLAPVTLHLPGYAVTLAHKEYKFKLIAGDYPAAINTTDATTIDGGSISLDAVGDRATIVKDGSNWQSI